MVGGKGYPVFKYLHSLTTGYKYLQTAIIQIFNIPEKIDFQT
jgi:hypothetical protein